MGAVLAQRYPAWRLPHRWRRFAIGLLLANVLAYIVYIGSGREHVEQAALAVKLIEIVALGLLLLPDGARADERPRRPRRAWLVLVGTILLLGVAYVMPEMMHVWIVENPRGQVGDRLDPAVLRARGIR